MYSVDHNDNLVHMYCTEPVNLLNIQNIMLDYNYLLNKIELNFEGHCDFGPWWFSLIFLDVSP